MTARPAWLELAARYLASRRRSLLGWAGGLATFMGVIVALYPSISDSESLSAAIEDYPDAIKEFLGGAAGFDLTTGAGFLNAEAYSLILPVLLAFVAVSIGASLGGDQQTHLMDVVLGHVEHRSAVVVAKAATIVLTTLTLSTLVALEILVLDPLVDLGVDVNHLAAATVMTSLFVILHGLVAALVGAGTGRRSTATGSAVVVLAAGYVLNGIGGLVDSIRPVRPLSPYHHAAGRNPLVEGWNVTSILVLCVLCGVAFVATIHTFERRDIV